MEQDHDLKISPALVVEPMEENDVDCGEKGRQLKYDTVAEGKQCQMISLHKQVEQLSLSDCEPYTSTLQCYQKCLLYRYPLKQSSPS